MMLGRLRRSFAAKLVAFEVGTILLVSLSLAALLISTRLLQTRALERSVAAKAVDAFRRDLDSAGKGAATSSQLLANYGPIVSSYLATDHQRLAALFGAEAGSRPEGESVVALDAAGHPILGRTASAQAPGQAEAVGSLARYDHLGLVALVKAGQHFPRGYIEPVTGGGLQLDGISPVLSGGAIAGFVLYSIDLDTLLTRLSPSGGGLQHSIFYDNRRLATTLDISLRGQGLPSGLASVDSAPTQFGIYNLGGHTYGGAYGAATQNPRALLAADVDDSVFAAQRTNDALVVLFTTTLLATAVSMVAIFFARRFALRPLAELGQGAARVGAGDYTTRVHVRSQDELGNLAVSFNAMSERIEDNTRQLESQRAGLDAAITSLSAVSRALTTTTAGEPALRQAVLDALTEITGADGVAMYSGADLSRVGATRGVSVSNARLLIRLSGVAAAAARGESPLVRLGNDADDYAGCSILVVPMVYEGETVGALAAFSWDSMGHVDVASLTVLANQATVALQNSALFQRERQTVARLQELDALKSDFLATIQHELRTPLTAIIGMTDLLDMAWQSWSDAEKLDAVGDVQLAAKGLYELVETTLDYSMLESDRLRLNLAPTQVRAAAVAALEDLTPLIKRHGVKVDIKVPEGLRAQADFKRLSQVLKALMDNAVKFSPDQSDVEVRGSRQNGIVTLEVVDQGIGIDPENQGRIFERFYQVDNTATRRYGGTGLGLALVRKLIELHDGKVEVRSTPGRGSTFTVSLPAVE
jgi:signal transduction histidine kinase